MMSVRVVWIEDIGVPIFHFRTRKVPFIHHLHYSKRGVAFRRLIIQLQGFQGCCLGKWHRVAWWQMSPRISKVEIGVCKAGVCSRVLRIPGDGLFEVFLGFLQISFGSLAPEEATSEVGVVS